MIFLYGWSGVAGSKGPRFDMGTELNVVAPGGSRLQMCVPVRFRHISRVGHFRWIELISIKFLHDRNIKITIQSDVHKVDTVACVSLA